ncbi:MAG: PVC-type heme-binding CxxCH protein, partial [Opitutaceae bacterium]
MNPLPPRPILALLLSAAATVTLSAAEPVSSLLPEAPAGIEVQLVAREPLIRNPCAIAFDSRGRLFVGQGPQYRNPKPDTPGDTVELLIDTDGDGIFDRTKTFARGLNCVQGMAWRGRDLYIANSPDLTIVRDLDGDDEADEYIQLYTDLGNIEHALHGLNFAPDGRLYMSKGNSKGLNQPERTAPHAFLELFGQKPLPGSPVIPPARKFTKDTYRATYQDPEDDWGRSGGVLRANPDGSELEIVSRGLRNPWDIAFDSEFTWLGTDNDQSDGDRIFTPFPGADFGWAHAWSPDWTGRNHLPTVPISGPVFTGSGVGIVFAENAALPASYRGVWFINDFQHRITYVYRPAWDGALLQPAGGKWQPFLTAGDSLFNPVDIELGPDGALYLSGWGTALGAKFKDGKQINEGRLWRIAATGTGRVAPAAHRQRPHSSWTFAELAADLAGPVAAYRTDASNELVRRGDAVRAELTALAARRDLPVSQQTWALWTLGRIAPSDPKLDQWFASEAATFSRNTRVQSLGILAHRFRESRRQTALPELLTTALRDPEPRVRFAAFQAARHLRRTELLDALCAATETESDRVAYYAAWHALAAVSSTDGLRAKLRDPRGGVRRAALLALLEQGSLAEPEVRPLLSDSDAATAGLAGLWLANRDGTPLLDISPAPGAYGADAVAGDATSGVEN